jgi:hypothetical protein
LREGSPALGSSIESIESIDPDWAKPTAASTGFRHVSSAVMAAGAFCSEKARQPQTRLF